MTPRAKRPGRSARDCPDCATLLSHCHDTLVEHADGSLECLGGPRCEERVDRHDLVVSCDELRRCGCLEPIAAGR